MASTATDKVSVQVITLAGQRYVIVPEADYLRLFEPALGPELPPKDANGNYPAREAMRALLARDIVSSRMRLGLAPIELARRAGVRPETLIRIEAGKISPSPATVDKIDRALRAAEAESVR